MADLIPPHGPPSRTNTLVNRFVEPERARELTQEASRLPAISLTTKQACDLEMIAMGAMSPLTGFVGQDDFRGICERMHLSSGAAWPIPITLSVDEQTKATLGEGKRAALFHPDGTLLGVIDVEEIYPHDKDLEIPNVFGTTDQEHPGAQAVREEGEWLIGGPIHVITVIPRNNPGEQFTEFRYLPAQTREQFASRGWGSVAAFQTRNPIHRAHEYLTKCAQELTDGLLIHPLVGQTKPGDIPAEVRMRCYQALIEKYYVPERTMLGVMPAAMRYAGPREAILHALIRQNYGVSHFIIGRNHAGVGDYYGEYDAQNIFNQFSEGEIRITPLKFEHASWCNVCEGMVSGKTCPHDKSNWVFLSGTKVRELLKHGERPPEEFSRPEVGELLLQWARNGS